MEVADTDLSGDKAQAEKVDIAQQKTVPYLVEFDSQKEGAFLAGTLWVAQYWVMRGDKEKFEQTLDAALRFMNDVGIMPEEGDPKTGEWLGNVPQAFVHASLIGVVIDYKDAFGAE